MNSLKGMRPAERGLKTRLGLSACLSLCGLFVLAAASPAAADQLEPPVVTVTFTPPQILAGAAGSTTLTVTINNPNPTPVEGILDNISFSDTYPAGLVFDAIGNYTCGTEAGTSGGSANFSGGGFNIVAESIPAGQSCNVVVLMHAASAGSFVDTTSAVVTGDSPDGLAASATLTATVPVPSLGSWGLIGFSLLLAAASYRAARRQRT